MVSGDDIGAGDQGIVIGYACREEGYLPREFQFIQNLMADVYKRQEPFVIWSW